MSTYPFSPFPIGWYQVAWSDELAAGEVKPLRFVGRELVLFRDEGGAAHVLDGHCPHLGAHLGYGGKVKDGCLQCPFHGWSFAHNGQCQTIPHAKKVPPKARIRPWTVHEKNQMILLWHHPEGALPSFDIPPLDELSSGAYRPMRRLDFIVSANMLEFNENIFDTAHFTHIHHYPALPEVEFEWNGPLARVKHRTHAEVLSRKIEIDIRNDLYGVGFQVVYLRAALFDLMLMVTKTPLDEERVQHRVSILKKRRIPILDVLLEQIAFHMIRSDTMRDDYIFSHKRFVSRPVLADTDGPIHRFRRWYAQFAALPQAPADAPPRSDPSQAA